MLLVSLHGLIIPIVTVASYSPTDATKTLDRVQQGLTESDPNWTSRVKSGLSSMNREIEDSIGSGIRIGDGIWNRIGDGTGAHLGSTQFPISPSTCITCDTLGEGGNDKKWVSYGAMEEPWMSYGEEEPWMRYGEEEPWMRYSEEVEEHRCPEWASAPPILDEDGNGKVTSC